MKRRLIKTCLTWALLITFFISCKKDKEDPTPTPTGASLSGKAQKGPFATGADVVVNELNSTLEPTENYYTTTVSDDAGSFSFDNINLSAGYASITVTGYYYMEPFNQVSTYRLSLEAVADVQSGSTINVNLLTHLIKTRIEKLVADGNTFSSARTQAQNELKTFFHDPSTDNTNFEDLTVADNGFLFAASLMFQWKKIYSNNPYNYTNDLIHLLNNFRSDFRDNGQIDSPGIIDTLMFNANRIELIDYKANLSTYMASFGSTVSITGFEQFIFAFQNAYATQVYSSFVFSDSTIFNRDDYSPVACRNVLLDTSVIFQSNTYNMSAIVPFDSSLTIKFTKLSPDTSPAGYSTNANIYGWSRTINPDGFTIESQRNNYPNGMLIWLYSPSADSARIDYFMNHQPVPYYSKKIYW